MAVATVPPKPTTFALALTVKEITGLIVGQTKVLWITAPSTEDVYVVSDGVTADGAALPANYFRIPANTVYPFEVRQQAILIAGSAGAANCTIRAV